MWYLHSYSKHSPDIFSYYINILDIYKIHKTAVINDPLGQTHAWHLFCFEKWQRTDGRTEDMCKNNDHYRPWLWVGLVDQLMMRHLKNYIGLSSFSLNFSLENAFISWIFKVTFLTILPTQKHFPFIGQSVAFEKKRWDRQVSHMIMKNSNKYRLFARKTSGLYSIFFEDWRKLHIASW